MGYTLRTIKKDELEHFGIPGMKWGQKRGQAKAEKLSKKYGVKVGVGVSKKHVKGALNAAKKYKEYQKNAIAEDHMLATTGKLLSQKQYDAITKKANKMISDIDNQSVKEIKKSIIDGKKRIEVIWND